MPRTEYVRCPNPRCGKLNPVDELTQGKEYTCVFCGHPFTSPAKTVQRADEASFKKRNKGKKPLSTSEARPENRNLRKPMI
ncbi:MAG: hypothetical protein ABIJ47_10400 [Candidatus Bathyarchaeota archaeon]